MRREIGEVGSRNAEGGKEKAEGLGRALRAWCIAGRGKMTESFEIGSGNAEVVN